MCHQPLQDSRKVGYLHVVSLKEKKEFEGPLELGESSREVIKSIKNFMKHCWFKFGHADARSLVEARRATVRALTLSWNLTFEL